MTAQPGAAVVIGAGSVGIAAVAAPLTAASVPVVLVAHSPAAARCLDAGVRIIQGDAGGASTTRPYAIDEFPLFVRAGSIVPLGPVVQYANEKPDAPYEIRIYPGADGRFTLYDDDGETYRYEKGEYATVALAWDDARQTLRIGAREGRFPGMAAQRTLSVRLMPSRAGDREQTRTVRYDGAPVELRFAP